ncbi:MAG: PAS domain S-box protein [Magnetococcales bacterium]|nr:PAS domain S-box protein [Magnetococcales bacterium]
MFQNKLLRNTFIGAILVTITFPLTSFFFIHPAFMAFLEQDKQNQAHLLGNHLASYLHDETHCTDCPITLTPKLYDEIQLIRTDFFLYKIRVFTPEGEIVYSSDVNEIGVLNTNAYFHDQVAKGRIYSKSVSKSHKTMEGVITGQDVIETYIPIMSDKQFLGAFEIYWDITRQKEQLENLIWMASLALLIIASALVFIIAMALRRESISLKRREIIEKQIHTSESRLRAMMDTALDTILILDSRGYIIDANPTIEHTFGITAKSITHLQLIKTPLVRSSEEGKRWQSLLDTLQSDRVQAENRHEFITSHADGSPRYLEVTASRISTENDTITTLFLRDITERKQNETRLQAFNETLEKRVIERTTELQTINQKLTMEITEREAVEKALRHSESYNRMLFEHSVIGLALCRMDGQLVDVNPAYAAIIGYDTDSVKQLTYWELTPISYADQESEQLLQLERNGRYGPYEKVYIHKDGHHVPVLLSGLIIEQDGERFIWSTVEDLSSRKRSERLAQEKLQAEAANKAKSAFLATMSHEIRTPINSILGMGDLLLETQLTVEQSKYVTILKSASESLQSLINDILDLSKIEANQLDFEHVPFNLTDTIEEITNLFVFPIKEKNLSLTTFCHPDLPNHVSGDANRLRQIVLNLMNNAIKFTPSGTIHLAVEPDKADLIRFSVRDSGIGIAPEKQQTIFRPFTQADHSTTREYGGTGLGLTICQSLVNLMGGTMGVESQPGQGSLFYFTAILPATTPNSTVQHETSNSQPQSGLQIISPSSQIDLKRLNILLVDDAEDNRFLVQAYMKKTQHSLIIAEDGQQAVDRYKEQLPDLVLMDLQMPVMDGLTATKTIRNWEIESNRIPVPIVALTAHAMKEASEEAFEAGCSYYLSKPIKKSRLLELIDQIAQP